VRGRALAAGAAAGTAGLLACGVAVVLAAAGPGGTAPVAVAPSFALTDARVSPRRAYFAGRPVQITFAIAAAAPLALQVDVVREATRKPS
jgi:hypothetical protein